MPQRLRCVGNKLRTTSRARFLLNAAIEPHIGVHWRMIDRTLQRARYAQAFPNLDRSQDPGSFRLQLQLCWMTSCTCGTSWTVTHRTIVFSTDGRWPCRKHLRPRQARFIVELDADEVLNRFLSPQKRLTARRKASPQLQLHTMACFAARGRQGTCLSAGFCLASRSALTPLSLRPNSSTGSSNERSRRGPSKNFVVYSCMSI